MNYHGRKGLCDLCHKPGHVRTKCPNLKKNPRWQPQTGSRVEDFIAAALSGMIFHDGYLSCLAAISIRTLALLRRPQYETLLNHDGCSSAFVHGLQQRCRAQAGVTRRSQSEADLHLSSWELFRKVESWQKHMDMALIINLALCISPQSNEYGLLH